MTGQTPEAARTAAELRLHGSCVAFRRDDGALAAVLIRAPSGGGKSAFALRLIALGARLVADDQTLLRREGSGDLLAGPPAALQGMIEARGLGLLLLPALQAAPLRWIVDLRMGGAEGRLPPPVHETFLGVRVPVVTLAEDERAAAALCCLVRDGALLDPEADLADLKSGGDGSAS